MSKGPWNIPDIGHIHPLTAWRFSQRLTQKDLARLAGVSAFVISKLERYHAVKLHHLRPVLKLHPGDFTAEYYVQTAEHKS